MTYSEKDKILFGSNANISDLHLPQDNVLLQKKI